MLFQLSYELMFSEVLCYVSDTFSDNIKQTENAFVIRTVLESEGFSQII